jgi:hypothetical protein
VSSSGSQWREILIDAQPIATIWRIVAQLAVGLQSRRITTSMIGDGQLSPTFE